MRIGVLRTQVPFVTGGAERHAANLCAALERHGHQAVEITLPFKWYPGEVLASHILAAKLLDLSEVEGVPIDMVVGLKFPAYLAPHPDKRFWIVHQYRQAYDMWSLGTSDLPSDPDGEALRRLVHEEDRAAFAATSHPILTNSRNVSARLKRYLDIESEPLYHPPPQAERFRQGDYGDYLFAPGRINPSKRLELILAGLAATRSQMRLVVAGVAENPAYQDRLVQMARDLGVADRVHWMGRIDDATMIRTYAGARAVVFVPQDEDYGYVTLEAMLAGKAVITTEDAGGPLEFVEHERNGLVVPASTAALGDAFERVMQDRDAAERWGQTGADHYRGLNIGWDQVVERLAGPSQSIAAVAPMPAASADLVDPTLSATSRPTATERLMAAIAPPPPPAGLPFETVEEVFDAYEFEELPRLIGEAGRRPNPELTGYIGTHWTRLRTTLAALGDEVPSRALDVGVFPPLVFQSLLANRYPGIRMDGLWEGPEVYHQDVRAHTADHPGFSITLAPANSERDRWPYEDETFDLVTAMEILEHLALDPHYFFREAARVLKPGGRFLVTTPNLVSHRAVAKVLQGVAPYSFGIFVPSGGVYGRHNREYTAPEVAELARSAGFEITGLATYDVYDRIVDPGTAELLVARGDDLSLRGENIVLTARKVGPATDAPTRLYHGDPTRMSASLKLGHREPETGLVELEIENRSTRTWAVSGEHATCLFGEWIDPDGVLRHQLVFQPIGAPIEPGTARTVRLPLDRDPDREGLGRLRLHVYQVGVGAFSGTGRSNTLTLPCSEEAFLRLAKSSPRPSNAS